MHFACFFFSFEQQVNFTGSNLPSWQWKSLLPLLTMLTALLLVDFEVEECSTDQFQCDNGQCIDLAQKCNELDECGDGSDEIDCGLY